MFEFGGLAWRLLLTAFVLGLAGAARMANAQDRDLPENVPQPQEHVELTLETIDQLCAFASNAGAGSARTSLESLLALQIEHIERTCGINEVQRKKLQLAGRGDIKRFFDRVDETKR